MEFESLYTGEIVQQEQECCKQQPIVDQEIWSAPVEEKHQELDEDAIIVEGCGYDTDLVEKPQLKYFEIANYLSELNSEYERHLVRKNLGISDKYSLTWGNISGNIRDQQDFVDFLEEQLQELRDLIMTPEEEPTITIYYGPSTSDLTLSNSNTIITGDYSDNIYILTPSENTEFYVNGIQGGFELQNDTMYKENTKFYIYKSFNSGLGVTKIVLKYGEDS